MIYETIVGRAKEEKEKIGKRGAGFIGKHIVGSGEDAHLTTKVFLDLLKPHVILIAGKRGSGKSYSAGVIVEEFLRLGEELRKKASFLIVDPMGIYWSMKFPNTQQKKLLEGWKLEPASFEENVKVFVPKGLEEEYKKAGIPIDGSIFLAPSEIPIDEWLLTFDLKRTDPIAIGFEKNFEKLRKEKPNFSLEELVEKVSLDEELKKEYKDAIISLLKVAIGWKIFSAKEVKIEEFVKPGYINIIDVSRMRSQTVRNLLVSILLKKIYFARVLARKEEEKAKIEGRKPEFTFPLTWVVLEEAHNFIPAEGEVASSQAVITLARQGREPGISLIVITQMPNKVHQDVLSQCDLVISFRLTSKDDLRALHAVMQTYMFEDIEKYIARLPKWPGAAIILDDTLEKVFTVQIRPRLSWHAGGTAALI